MRIGVLIVAAAFAAGSALADIIVRPKGAGPASALVTAIAKETGARVVDLSGSSSADAALLPREAHAGDVVYAIGPDAVAASKSIEKNFTVVALNVPNPDRQPALVTFVSSYPSFAKMLEVMNKLGIKSAGLLYSPGQNHEMALKFAGEFAKRGVKLQPIPATGGSAAASLRPHIGKINAVVLLIDPLLFDERTMHEILAVTAAAKIPTIGFLPELASVGVTFALTTPAAQLAALAVRNAPLSTPGTRRTVELDALEVTASKKSADELGLDLKAIGGVNVR